MATLQHNKIKLREVNRHLVCRLCRGYYVDATTIAECLHSFCRSCIIKYLAKNSFCPICEVQIHKTKPYLNLRLDKALQDVVYKLVPGLYHDEMKRRRDFYSKHQEHIPVTTPEQCGLEERIIFSPEDSISLSLEYSESDDYESENVSSQSSESGDSSEGLSFPQQLGLMKLKNEVKNSRRECQDGHESSVFPKRYLQCPAVVSVYHLKKFIRMKHDLTDKMKVEIIHKRVPLPDHYTLMDVAYIYTWKRSAPMKFLYRIYNTKKRKIKIISSAPEKKEVKPSLQDLKKQTVTEEEKPAKCEVVVKKETEVDKISDVNVSKNLEKGLTKEVKQTEVKIATEKTVEMKSSPESKINSVATKIAEDGKSENLNSVKKSEEQSKNTKTEPATTKVPEIKTETKENSAETVKVNNLSCLEQSKTKDKERLLLNPVSGQLEPVPSTNDTLENANAAKGNETAEVNKKTAVDNGPSKPQVENHKEPKKSNVNLLKNFRKEKPTVGKEPKGEIKSGGANSLTIAPVVKSDKPIVKSERSLEKEPAKVSVEIKSDNKSSEYDFDGTSPPSKIMPLQEYSKYSKHYMADHKEKWLGKQSKHCWMSLQDFRLHMLKENNSNGDSSKKYKRKSVPSLYRITTEANKKSNKKTPNEKVKGKKVSPTIINIKTETENSNRTEIEIEVKKPSQSPPRPIKIENKGGEYSIKQKEDDTTKKSTGCDSKPVPETKTTEETKSKTDAAKPKESLKRPPKTGGQEKPEGEIQKKAKPSSEESKDNHFGAIDLSKSDSSPKTPKNPLENIMDMAAKSGSPKSDEKMVEALISAAQKQSIEPLLKIPHYSNNVKNSSQGSPPPGKNISSSDISQALQFFKDLRSDLKILEAKSQLSPNAQHFDQIAQKSSNLEPIQLYQQHIDLIRRLKRQHMASNESEPPLKKQSKSSPTSSESKKKSSPSLEVKPKISDETAHLKSSMERTISQIQEQMELQSRLIAAQNYKNLPALLQFYNRPSTFCPGPTSPSKSSQLTLKPSSHSPNSQKSPNSRKSPPSLTSSSSLQHLATNATDSFFNSPSYSHHLINAGLNSEMTFHQMFQNYLNQQDKLNQLKHSPALPKKPLSPSTKSLSALYYGSQAAAKKQEPNVVPAAQKT